MDNVQRVQRRAGELGPLVGGGLQFGGSSITTAAEGVIHLHLQQRRQSIEAGADVADQFGRRQEGLILIRRKGIDRHKRTRRARVPEAGSNSTASNPTVITQSAASRR
jgi:hypothetical protein